LKSAASCSRKIGRQEEASASQKCVGQGRVKTACGGKMPSSFAAVRYFQQVAFQPQGPQLALPARRFVPALPEELPDMSADPSLQLEDGWKMGLRSSVI